MGANGPKGPKGPMGAKGPKGPKGILYFKAYLLYIKVLERKISWQFIDLIEGKTLISY